MKKFHPACVLYLWLWVASLLVLFTQAVSAGIDTEIQSMINTTVVPVKTENTAQNQKNLIQNQRLAETEGRLVTLQGSNPEPGPEPTSEPNPEPEPTPGEGVYIVDDSDPGFSVSGPYTTTTGDGYKNTYVAVAPYYGQRQVSWQFDNPTGMYEVFVRYVPHGGHGGIAYIVDGQEIPMTQTTGGLEWTKIGTLNLSANTRVTSDSNGYTGTNYDAVKLKHLGPQGNTDDWLGYQGCMDSFDAGADGWCKISPATLADLQPQVEKFPHYHTLRGNGGLTMLMQDWVGAGLDTDELEMAFFGGGHNDNDLNLWAVYDIQAGAFEIRIPPSEPTHYVEHPNGGYCLAFAPGNPAAVHTYDGVEYDPVRKTMMLFSAHDYTDICSSEEPTDLTKKETLGWQNYEINLSKTETRMGIPPLSARVAGGITIGTAGSVYMPSGMKAGERGTLNDTHWEGNTLVVDGPIFDPGGSGQGSVDEFRGGIVGYQNGGAFKHVDPNGNTVSTITGTQSDTGLACCDDVCLLWDGNKDFLQYTYGDTSLTQRIEEDGPHGGFNRIYSKFRCLHKSKNIFIGVSNYQQPVHLYKWAGEPTASTPSDQSELVTAKGSGAFQ